MPDLDLAWLDNVFASLPKSGVPGVPGVLSRKTAVFSGTPSDVAGVPGVPEPASEHLGTPRYGQGVPAKSLILQAEHLEHLGTPISSNVVELEGLAGEWLDRIRSLRNSAAPMAITADRWQQVRADAEKLVLHWGDTALGLGWEASDLFTVPRGPERWGGNGLAVLLCGRRVVAMTAETATIPNRVGAPNRYMRYPWQQASRGVLLWDSRAFSGSRDDV